jgi:hypothetical protein
LDWSSTTDVELAWLNPTTLVLELVAKLPTELRMMAVGLTP